MVARPWRSRSKNDRNGSEDTAVTGEWSEVDTANETDGGIPAARVPQASAEALPPDPAAEPAPPALELLVHGVGGVTPQEMLDDPSVVRVAGDAVAGVYRRPADVDAEDHPPEPGDPDGGPGSAPVIQEAYSWSGLTSGNSSRALWLLLLPFMIVNLAHWMRPPTRAAGTDGGVSRGDRVYDVVVRLLALSLTVLFAAGACEVAMDLLAWQCAGAADCVHAASWLGFLSAARHGWWSPPGRRIAVAAVLPLALVGLLWWLSHRTWAAYESQRPGGSNAPGGTPGAPPLALRGFWYGRRFVARLRATHTAIALLTVATALLLPALREDRHAGGWLSWAGWTLAVLVAAAALAAITVTVRHSRNEGGLDSATDRLTVRVLPVLSAALLLLGAVYSSWWRPGWVSGGRMPGADAFGAVTLLQGVLVVALAVVVWRAHRGAAPRHGRVAVRGYGGPLVAVLACALGGVFTGGTAQRIADWLDRGGTPGTRGSTLAGPPVLLSWQAAAIPVMLLVLAVLALLAALRLRRVQQAEEAVVRAGHPGVPEDPSRTRQIAGAIARAGLTDSSPVLVAVISGGSFLLGAAGLAGAWGSGRPPVGAAAGAPRAIADLADTTQALGSWLLGAAAVALLALGRLAYRNLSARRTVGILWDVGTYWPRAAHPFAPPCYAERAVPDLTWRIATWTERTGGRLVLSGHSQGTVLAASAVWQLTPATRRRIALLTYGSPLERLYGRWFPAYFGPAQLRMLHGELHDWRNLWRRTDPIGGPIRLTGVGGHAVDVGPLPDPAAYGRDAQHPLPTPILAHSDYQADPAFAVERAALLARIPEPDGAAAIPGSEPADGGADHGSSGRSSG
jgi:hypothetical protein